MTRCAPPPSTLLRLKQTALRAALSPVAVSNLLLLWLARWRDRRALDALSDHMLKDMGLSRADAAGESGKPFWRQ